MPCEDCFEYIKSLGIRKVIYSKNEYELCKININELKPFVKKSLGRRYLNNVKSIV